MQTTVLQNQKGINVIKLFKITTINEYLKEENEKISESKKFCMGLEKKKQQNRKIKNNYAISVVYTELWFSIFSSGQIITASYRWIYL